MSPAPPPVPSVGAEGPELRAVLRSLVPSVYAPTFLEWAGMCALLPVITLMALDLGFSVPAAAALTLIFGVGAVIGPIPSGWLMRAIGARRALVITGIIMAAANVAAMLVIGPGLEGAPSALHRWALVALLVVVSACSQVWGLGRQSYLGTALPPTMRARGMTLFGGTLRMGDVLGPLLGAAVMAAGHEAWVFGLFAVLTGLATALVGLFMVPGEQAPAPNAPAPTVPALPEEPPTAPAPVEHAAPASAALPRSTARTALAKGVLRRMLVVGTGIVPVMMARVNRPVIVPLLGAGLGLDATTISLIIGISALADIAMVIPAGILMDRYGRAAVAVPCSLILGAGFVLLGIVGWTARDATGTAAFLAVLLPSLVIALGNGLGAGILMTLGIDLSPVHGRTTYLAWWNTMLGVGRMVAPLLLAGIALVAPVPAAAVASGALCLVGGAWLARVLPRHTPTGTRRPRPHAGA
ncbi:MFS transporter [Brachybacterium sp. JHP9]|uniref:MFS transporter n=1 Tax=Brachybacterium equifaecis TaxID=2910770 RepID=A0ABT0QX35_9MICO|nr:MFS transporter [Brachybacterium equifaecis]